MKQATEDGAGQEVGSEPHAGTVAAERGPRQRRAAGRRSCARAVLPLALLSLAALTANAAAPARAPDVDGYVGSAACAGCHAAAWQAWEGSHHDRAMEPATPATVLGDFADSRFTHQGVTSSFFVRDGRYFVNTENAAGELEDFEIAYTFGVEPLQQYLVEFPNGALQVLGVAWDTRPGEAGGQRWFHVYGDEPIDHDDELHWTARSQTWNYQCADCHSVNLRKGYDAEADSYATTWATIDVGCEGCHGPGAKHVSLAPHFTGDDGQPLADLGLTHRLGGAGEWHRHAEARVAARTKPADGSQVNACARCHARRAQLRERPFTGQPFLDDYRPALLTPELYHADGQIDDEVYVWGSFLQSRMHQAGVVCSNCHDPHSNALRQEGNAVCTQCHAPKVYDVADHHHHEQGTAGARCVECHMPSQRYMVIDARRDHSMRVPRPALAAAIGAPDACTACHQEQSQDWAAAAIRSWSGPSPDGAPSVARRLAAAWSGDRAAARLLEADHSVPQIVRATALHALARASGLSPDAIVTGAADDAPLVRLAALETAAPAPQPVRLQAGLSGLHDDLLAVRVAAARLVADLHDERVPPALAETFKGAMADYERAQRQQADYWQALVNLGAFYADRRRIDDAQRAYESALGASPDNTAATLGLSDLYRATGDEDAAVSTLRSAIRRVPERAALHHALGLALVRQKHQTSALASLERAAALAPAQQRFTYVYAVALRSYGQAPRALAVMEDMAARLVPDGSSLMLLAELNVEAGNRARALEYGERLAASDPDDPGAASFLEALRRSPP